MSLQSSTFTTAHVLDNEIVKANDFEFAFENIVTNVSKATQMFLESTQDFVINGKVTPYQGMNVRIAPIFGVCKATGIPFGRTESAVMEYGFEESENGRVDIIEVQGDWQTYDNQQRAFNDPDTDTQTYQYVDTKKLMFPSYRIKQGTEGSSVAPEVDEGFVKLAEVVIRPNNSTIEETDIKNITSDIAGQPNEGWTIEQTATYNIGYISDVNERFRVAHNQDGSHKNDVINTDSLNIGVGTKQVNGNVLPFGAAITIPSQSASSATDSIVSVLTKLNAVVTSIYDAFLKYGDYCFKGDLTISSIVDIDGDLIKPLVISAPGDGTAVLKLDGDTVLSIDGYGKLSTNGYTATSPNHIVTKAVTDSISTALTAVTQRVATLEANFASNKEYVNATLSSGTDGRYNSDNVSIYAATTENVTLAGSQSIDGLTLADGVTILVKNQDDATENGLYQYSSSSSWARLLSYSNPMTLKGKLFTVSNGTTQTGKMFYVAKQDFNDTEAFGSDTIDFFEYFGSVKELGNKLALRDSSGHVKTATPTAASDAVNKGALLDLIYPIGSIYWSSKSTNPASLFGGTWTQIKDKFVWAMGDGDTVNATGGAKTVTLEVANLPSHNHSFTGTAVTSGANNRGHTHSVTAAGTITVKTNPTFAGTAVTSGANSRGHTHSVTASGTVSAHSHGLNNHTHSFTPAGSVKVTTNPTFSGTAVNTGAMSANSTGAIESSKFKLFAGSTDGTNPVVTGNLSITNKTLMDYGIIGSNAGISKLSINVAHTHSVTAAGTISGGAYSFTGTAGTTGGSAANTANATPTFKGTAVTSGAESQNHTHSVTAAGTISGGAYTFTGSAVTSGGESQNHTHSVTAAGTIGNTGSGTAVNKMPPYICKYCWERTA